MLGYDAGSAGSKRITSGKCRRYSSCLLLCISARVLQRVSKHRNETSIVRGLGCQVRRPLVADQKDGLRRPTTTVSLDPLASHVVTHEHAGPNADPLGSQRSVGHFQHNTAHVLVGKEIVSSEPQVIHSTFGVEEERITAPAGEESVREERNSRRDARSQSKSTYRYRQASGRHTGRSD